MSLCVRGVRKVIIFADGSLINGLNLMLLLYVIFDKNVDCAVGYNIVH
jgi:hypothetical protein